MSTEELNNPGTPEMPQAGIVRLDEVRAMLVALSNVLLSTGYAYFDANEHEWPLTPTLLVNGRQWLCLTPWLPERHEAIRQLWEQARAHFGNGVGLLLVGHADIQHPALEQLLQQAPGALAYVDIGTHRYRISDRASFTPTSPGVLREDAFPRLLDNAARATGLTSGQHDLEEHCRQALSAQLQYNREQRNFQQATRQASRDSRRSSPMSSWRCARWDSSPPYWLNIRIYR